MQPTSKEAIQNLFTEARTHHAWTSKQVPETLLRELYDIMKWGPTSANCLPMRAVFVQGAAAKEKLLPALMGGNVDQVKAAPVTAIIAYDEKFYTELPRLFPAMPGAKNMFESNATLSQATAFRNSSLQGGYLILAARALGLDACPMSGFDNGAVDKAFFSGTTWKSNFICNLGYGDASKLFPRGPRLSFEEACKIL
jgi:3-hydroxypropanoate dehydrogenase